MNLTVDSRRGLPRRDRRPGSPCEMVAILLMAFLIVIFGSNPSASAQHADAAERKKIPASIQGPLLGIWKQCGDGRILKIDSDRCDVFHYTKSTTYRDIGASGKALADTYALCALSESNSRLKLWRWDFEDRCQSQFYEEFERMEELPPGTIDDPDTDARFQDPTFTMTLLCEHFDEHFPHFARRNVNWEKRKQSVVPQIVGESSKKQLFHAFCQMLEGFGDSHTRIYWDKKDQPFKSGTAKILVALNEAFENQNQIKSKGEFFGNWAQRVKSSVKPMLEGPLKFAANDRFRWGTLKGNIGYIENDLITAFSPAGTSRPDDLVNLETELDTIIENLQGCRAVLLDLSFNQGGYEPAAMMIASRFADRKRLIYRLSAPGSPALKPRPFFVSPRGARQFTKPVFVLTSQSTVSCGESLTLMLNAFPHVQQLGEPTRGCLSSFLNKPLQNGFHLTFSNEIYESPDGDIAEGRGVMPEVEFPVFDPQDIEASYPNALKFAVSHIEKTLEGAPGPVFAK